MLAIDPRNLEIGLVWLNQTRAPDRAKKAITALVAAEIARQATPLVFRLAGDQLTVGEGGSTVTMPASRIVDAAVLVYVFAGRSDLANGLLDLLEPRGPRGATALRHRLRRLARTIETAGYRRLATAVRGVKVHDATGDVYVLRDRNVSAG